jgi:mannonate dehydratase
VAEEAGVKVALHPDDPPMPVLRDTARLVHRPELYQRVLDLYPSEHNCMEFCIGTLSEMPGSDIKEVVDRTAGPGGSHISTSAT